MKKLILLSFLFIAGLSTVQAQDHVRYAKKKAPSEVQFKATLPTVSVKVIDTTFSQVNFITGFDQVTVSHGVWSANATSFSFTPSYTFGKATVITTATQSGDTIYHYTNTLQWGAGLTIYENVATGKAGIAPTFIIQIGSTFAIIGGHDFGNQITFIGASASLADELPFLNQFFHGL